jgi:hypothetical protein
MVCGTLVGKHWLEETVPFTREINTLHKKNLVFYIGSSVRVPALRSTWDWRDLCGESS